MRELKAAGAEQIFVEYEHGDAKVKSQQQAMFVEAQAGDTIIVLEVSRLARSTQQLCEIIELVRPQVSKEDIPATFLRHYPAYKNGQLNISELARVCDISRTTAYKYKSLLEA